MRPDSLLFGALCLALPALCQSAVVGSMTPAQALTEARVAALPPGQRAPWQAYLVRSRALMASDQAALAAEQPGAGGAAVRPHADDNGMALRRPGAWYGTPAAWKVAQNILSFQTPAGGWGKNIDRAGPPRAPGEHYAPPGPGQRGGSGAPPWNYVGTFDNGATTTELRFLARVQAATAGAQADSCRAAFLRGLRYVLDAQYPNGGFPQVYPLQGGYHDAVTLNDDAMVRVLDLLLEVAQGQGDFAFVPAAFRAEAQEALARSVALLVRTQHVAGGERTGWAQQYDALTLALAGARNFEPAARARAETAGVLMLLMRLPDPSPTVQGAVEAGVAWLRAVAIRDAAWTADPPEAGRRLLPRQGAEAIWARYYDARSMRPVFGDRDRSIHDDVNELQIERRNGYAWFGSVPARALARYATWSQPKRARVILVGDSTMAPRGGYGDALCRRLAPAVACINQGRAGRSTSSYRAEGHWDAVRGLLEQNGEYATTYVLVQFGHNDQPGKPGRSTDLKTEFPANMARYAREAAASGATPVLVTPLARRGFENGKLADTLAPWAAATRAVAAQQGAALLDLHAATMAAFAGLGEAKAVNLGPPPKPDAKGPDLTHLNDEGAEIVAPIVLDRLRKAVPLPSAHPENTP